MAEFTKERIIEDLKASTQNASGMFEISEDTICALMSMLTNAAPQLPQPAVLSASEGVLKSLLPDAEKSEFWFEHNGKIFFEGVKFNNAVFEACRAAMLQGDEPVQGWIPCSERMPDKGQEVLCTDQFENYETALYDTGYIPGPPFFATTAGEFHPTHWMPLPAAPQQEAK